MTPTRMTLKLADRSNTHPKGVTEDVCVKVGKFYFLIDFVLVEFKADPRVPLILGRSFLRTGRTLIDVYREEITLRVNDESIIFNLNQTMRYSLTYDDTLVNRVDVIDIACEEFVQDVLDFQYNLKSSSPTLVSDDLIYESDARKVPIVKSSSPTLTPFGESDLFLEEIKDFLNDDSIPTGIENSSLLANKDKLFELAKVSLNENCSAMLLKKLPEKLGDPADPRVPLILGRSFLRTGCALIDVYGKEITLRYNPKGSSPTLVFDVLVFESDSSKESIVKSSLPTLTLFGESDFFLEEIKDFLNDDSIPTGIENSVYDPEGDILFLKKLLNEDPFQLLSMDLKLAEKSKAKYFIEETPELELKELPSHLEYAFLEDSNKLPVIIAKNLMLKHKLL
uniref:Reverse transcriptase domain-containing protein n=1 Tax=Tanacetum cinerariifolium TaxID=118510 RepID=A0A699L746_TANCI|nr:reverse transcriptase domain-containing protein [Tanacetum cinerariifolium]